MFDKKNTLEIIILITKNILKNNEKKQRLNALVESLSINIV